MTPQEAVRAARRAVDRSEWAAFAKAANDRWQAEKRRREAAQDRRS